MKKFIWIVLVIIIGGYTACHWDYHLSNYLFEKYCNEEGRVGLFVYEIVELDVEYFMPFPADKDPRDLNQRFVVGENLMINREQLEQDYILGDYKKSVPLSDIGPIVSLETSVFRKSDGKLLGKAANLASRRGWWHRRIIAFGQNSTEDCPVGYDEKGLSYSEKFHSDLIKEIFYSNSTSIDQKGSNL